MPTPGSGVDIENLIFLIPGIKFKLHFGDAIKPDTLQKLSPSRFNDRLDHCLHECAGIAEINRILPFALGHKRGIYAPVFAYRTERKLILSPAGNTLLNEDFIRWNVPAHLSKPSFQLWPGFGRQSFNIRLWEEMMIDGWFQNYRI